MANSQPTFPHDIAPIFVPMQLHDIDEVIALEVRCFPTPWTATLYRRELTRNRLGSYWVVRGDPTIGRTPTPILAYAGMWIMEDEAHITTIATRPDWRRRHLGEWTLLQLLARARIVEVERVTLEVREHNLPAQKLYQKTGFVEVGRRKGYYHDTGEDALLLTLFGMQERATWRRLQAHLATIERHV